MTWLNGTNELASLRSRACSEFGRNFTMAEIDRVLRHLEEMNLLRRTSESENSTQHSPPRIPDIAASECVHIQLTESCNLHCPACYLPGHRPACRGLDIDRLIALIDEMASLGVFQLAIGGGEPLLSPVLIPLVQHARKRGILPNITTNGTLLAEDVLTGLAGHVGEIRLSCDDGRNTFESWFAETANKIRQAGINAGFNLIVTRPMLPKLRPILARLGSFSPTSLVLIRPKPGPANEEWYADNALGAEDCRDLAHVLAEEDHGGLALDCAFSFLFCKFPERHLRRLRVQGCAGGRRFCVVKADGDVYPCSHLHDKSFGFGNVRQSPLAEIMRNSRPISDILSNAGEPCHSCRHGHRCGGCKAIALHECGDISASDPGCPYHSQSG